MPSTFRLAFDHALVIQGGSVVELLRISGACLSYKHDDVFEYVPNRGCDYGQTYGIIPSRRGELKRTLFSKYFDETESFLSTKLLVDTFMYRPVKTIFCLQALQDSRCTMTKGNKKLMAFDTLDMCMGHMLFTGVPQSNSTIIDSDEQLYWLLRKIDPETHDFNIIVEETGIHYAESSQTMGRWANSVIHARHLLTKPKLPVKIRLLGKAYTTDDRLLPCDNDPYCTVHATQLTHINLDYVFFCSCNLLYMNHTRVATTLDNNITIHYVMSGSACDYLVPSPH